MTLRLAVLALLVAPLALPAQPARGPKKKDDTPPGYKKDNLRGFTLYFSDDVLEEDRNSKLPRKPLEALERELIIVESVVPADKVKKLKAVPIWVEWDERVALGNGRVGGAVAVFYGGHQANVVGSSPFKSNAVTVLSLRSLTAEHQPATDSGRCVTLHELAHAFHYHVLGNDNPQVKAAYKQAMERKLYDPGLYVATNDHEYFAELSCCYLEKLDYYPRTRDDLKKLDPKGYELMEKTWGKIVERKGPAVARGPKLASPDGDGQFPLTGTTDRVRPGEALVGAVPAPADWKGRPVVAVQFPAQSGRAVAVLPRLSSLHAELKDFGLIAFAAETSEAPKAFLEKLARQRALTIPLVGDSQFGVPGTYRLPHAWVYDHTGKSVFRGNPLDADGYVRIAVGKAVLARLGKEPSGKAITPVADLLAVGAPMPQVFAKLNDQLRANPKDADLTELQTVLTAGGKKVLEEATERAGSDPVGAFFEAERLPSAYRGTPVEKPATDLLNKLRGNVKVERELRARSSLAQVLKLDTQLSGKEMSFDPRLPEFKEENAQLLKQLTDGLERVRKAYPGSRAADEAARLADRWDVRVK